MPIPYGVTAEEAQYPMTGGPVAALGGWHVTLNPNSEQLDAVTQVIRAAMQPDFQLTLLSVQGWLPPRPELFNSGEAQNVPVVGRYGHAAGRWLQHDAAPGDGRLERPVQQDRTAGEPRSRAGSLFG